MGELLLCLDDPALAILQWMEAFGVVQVNAHNFSYPDGYAWPIVLTQYLPFSDQTGMSETEEFSLCVLQHVRAHRHICMQTRLPPELAMELESITAEYQETLVLLAESGSDVGENDPMHGPLTFPAQALLTAMDCAVTVGRDITFRWQMPRW